MRDIKFRAWNKIEKRMLQVHDIYFLQNTIRCHNPKAKKGDREYGIYFEWKILDKERKAQKYGPAKASNEEISILMQYTGLKDKKGKEIYEGDIVKTYYDWNKDGYIVEFGEYTVNIDDEGISNIGFYIKRDRNKVTLPQDNMEVIGNIWENPKLLK
jgi:uncharacterized phage protein (TIGR01671 family)